MRGEQNLRSPGSADPAQDRRQLSHHRRVQRQLRFFQKHRPPVSRAVQQRPQQADQPQGAVREIPLVLHGRSGPPVLVAGFEMPAAELVLRQRELVELGHGDLEGLVDPLQVSPAGLFGGFGDSEQEIGTVRIRHAIPRPVRVPNQMRDEMKVPDGPEVVDDRAEVAVGVDLFEVRLRHPLAVCLVVGSRSAENPAGVGFDDFLVQDRPVPAPLLGGERDLVAPS